MQHLHLDESLYICNVQQHVLAGTWSSMVQLLWVSADLYLCCSHEAEGWGLGVTGLWSRGTHGISPSFFSRCRRRNSELSYNGCYCLSLLAGMGIRGEFLLPTAPVVSVGIKHSLMKNKHQDTFFIGLSFVMWTASTGHSGSSFGVPKLKLE